MVRIVLVALLLLSGCVAASPNPAPGTGWRVVDSGSDLGDWQKQPRLEAWERQAEWSAWWAENRAGRGDLPMVDFEREWLLGVWTQAEPDHMVRLRVEDVMWTADHTVLRYWIVEPGHGCLSAPAYSQPYQILALERPRGEPRGRITSVSWEEVGRTTVAC